MTTDAAALQALLDDRAIRDVVLRYCRGIDRMDRELVRSCYFDDASDSHGSFEGGVEAFLDWVWRVLGRYDATMHIVANTLVEFAPRREGAPAVARVESYGMALHRKEGGGPKLNLTTGFRYIDRFEQRGDALGWRIARRTATTEWVRRNTEAESWPIPEGMETGQRGPEDALYRGFPEFAAALRSDS